MPEEGQKKEVPSPRAPVLRGAAPWRACPLAVHPGPRTGSNHPSKARPPLPVLPFLPSSPFWSTGQPPAPAFWHPQKLKLARSVLPRGQHANYSSQAAASLPGTQERSCRPRGLLPGGLPANGCLELPGRQGHPGPQSERTGQPLTPTPRQNPRTGGGWKWGLGLPGAGRGLLPQVGLGGGGGEREGEVRRGPGEAGEIKGSFLSLCQNWSPGKMGVEHGVGLPRPCICAQQKGPPPHTHSSPHILLHYESVCTSASWAPGGQSGQPGNCSVWARTQEAAEGSSALHLQGEGTVKLHLPKQATSLPCPAFRGSPSPSSPKSPFSQES